ncbi:MAG: class I SAM-dependent methyltransferase [Woeseiaceae bacterium]
MRNQTVLTLLIIALAACGSDDPAPAERVSRPAAEPAHAPSESIYKAAVEHADRTDADRARDAGRRPAEVLEFFGIEAGMDILDMFSGGGYYTEILSRVAGAEGSVVAHSNEAYAQFVGEEATNRYASNRLANVKILMAENQALEFPNNAFDAVLMVLAYHDVYYVAPKNGWPKINGPKLVAELFDALRPGGILGVVDHYAAAGSGRETGNSLHRIDPEIVISELLAAGFVLEEKSDLLRNMDDDHSLNMSDPKVRGKTDRFVLRFRKPR